MSLSLRLARAYSARLRTAVVFEGGSWADIVAGLVQPGDVVDHNQVMLDAWSDALPTSEPDLSDKGDHAVLSSAFVLADRARYWAVEEPLPVCAECLASSHCGSVPDFAHRPASKGEACCAADHPV